MDKKSLTKIGIFKTLYVNFHCCRFSDAVHLPVIVARNVNVEYCGRRVFVFPDGCKTGMFTVGFNRHHNNGNPSSLCLRGNVVLHGMGVHAFGAGCYLIVSGNGVLEIGDHFGCTGDTRVTVGKHLSIGRNNLWSYGCTVMDTDGHKIFDRESGNLINEPREVVFGDDVWMGNGCTVLKGSVIPSGCVIASRSMISKPLSGENNILSTQGKVLKTNIRWEG